MRKAFKNFVESFKKDEKGMTLVELLAVIVILAIVGVIAFVAIGNVIDNSRKDAHVANAQQVLSAAELYQASGGKLPETGEDVAVELTGEGSIDTVDEEMVDPWDSSNDDYIDNFKLTYSTSDQSFEIASEGTTNNKCNFTATTKVDLAAEGREACTD